MADRLRRCQLSSPASVLNIWWSAAIYWSHPPRDRRQMYLAARPSRRNHLITIMMRVCQRQRRHLCESLREWLLIPLFTRAFLKSPSSRGLSAIAELLVLINCCYATTFLQQVGLPVYTTGHETWYVQNADAVQFQYSLRTDFLSLCDSGVEFSAHWGLPTVAWQFQGPAVRHRTCVTRHPMFILHLCSLHRFYVVSVFSFCLSLSS